MKQKIFYDSKLKKLVSFRDGVQEYLGAELDMTPHDKVFRVYKSPEEVTKAAKLMPSLHITDEHIALDADPSPVSIGNVLTSDVVDVEDPDTSTTVTIENTVLVTPDTQTLIDNGKRELSLGYLADLRPHAGEFDLEQSNIRPKHLAIVPAGRCGQMCSFTDKESKMTDENKAVEDAEEAKKVDDTEAEAKKVEDTETEAVDSVESIAEEVAKLSREELEKVAVMIAAMLKEGEEAPAEAAPTEDAEKDEEKDKDISDSKAFKDAVFNAARRMSQRHIDATDKGRHFLPETYNFKDATPCKIMRDCLATRYREEFSDDQVEVAFKMLQPTTPSYAGFADAEQGTFSSLSDKEL